MKTQRSYARHHAGLILAIASLISAGALMPGTAKVASAQTVYPSWSYTGNLSTARADETATLLQNGKVLVTGGFNSPQGRFTILDTAELYDPDTGTWSSTGNLNNARYSHTATLLRNGKVLVVGGNFNAQLTAEIYDPAAGTWSSTGNLSIFSFGPATLLQNGKVLVFDENAAEVYDPATGTWSSTGKLNYPRFARTATLLPNGNILVAGGIGNEALSLVGTTLSFTLSSAEVYDPATGKWTPTAYLNSARWGHTATLLRNGKVLVEGGGSGNPATPLNSAELYDSSSIPNTNIIDDAPFLVHQHYAD